MGVDRGDAAPTIDALEQENEQLRVRLAEMSKRVFQGEERRRAMIHIMDDLHATNRRLGDQRRAMLHILVDYEQDRRRLGRQSERLDSSRRALLHILQDTHGYNERLERSRKAMIHIMQDLRQTTEDVQRREQELRDKQEQLVQTAKLATLGELTTGIAHELNNPLNNIGLYIGNVVDQIHLKAADEDRVLDELTKAQNQVGKAAEIISHLRTFGRAAMAHRELVSVNSVVNSAVELVHEQLRLREIATEVSLAESAPVVTANAIQLEQVLVNLLTNARDAVADCDTRRIAIATCVEGDAVHIEVQDSGPGIPAELGQRIFDPFFTTKEVGAGTGLGLSIAYGIIQEHEGEISVTNADDGGARFTVALPRATVHATPGHRS